MKPDTEIRIPSWEEFLDQADSTVTGETLMLTMALALLTQLMDGTTEEIWQQLLLMATVTAEEAGGRVEVEWQK